MATTYFAVYVGDKPVTMLAADREPNSVIYRRWDRQENTWVPDPEVGGYISPVGGDDGDTEELSADDAVRLARALRISLP